MSSVIFNAVITAVIDNGGGTTAVQEIRRFSGGFDPMGKCEAYADKLHGPDVVTVVENGKKVSRTRVVIGPRNKFTEIVTFCWEE